MKSHVKIKKPSQPFHFICTLPFDFFLKLFRSFTCKCTRMCILLSVLVGLVLLAAIAGITTGVLVAQKGTTATTITKETSKLSFCNVHFELITIHGNSH